MMKTKVFDASNKPLESEKKEIADFLFDHLEQYGDPKSDILKAVNYSTSKTSSFSGFTMLLLAENDTVIAVINLTGMGA